MSDDGTESYSTISNVPVFLEAEPEDEDTRDFLYEVEQYYEHDLMPRYRVGCYLCGLLDAELPLYDNVDEVIADRHFTCIFCQRRVFERLPTEVRSATRMCHVCGSLEPVTEMASLVRCWACALLAT